MPEIRFSLRIPLEEYFAYYEGAAESVIATASDGRTVQFPARLLRQFLTWKGVFGEFVIEYDDHHKLVAIEKVRDL
ncbi:MAG: DUF2835 domain-containing protein [Candidatus Methylomirabilia bacterium]